MLYLLTGDIQSGKTRWLSRLIEELSLEGTSVYGVLAPGVWTEHQGAAGETVLEKLGIDNVLLPQQERISFARRRDLAEQEGSLDHQSQSSQAQLGWEIDEGAMQKVNRHFDEIARKAKEAEAKSDSSAPVKMRGLLVVDELGYLEIVREQGLTSAIALLKAGPTALYQQALIVARTQLYEVAEKQFAPFWQSVVRISPDETGRLKLLNNSAGLSSELTGTDPVSHQRVCSE